MVCLQDNEWLEEFKKKFGELEPKKYPPGWPGDYHPVPQGPVGWICPRCGRGLSPFAQGCGCHPGPEFPPRTVFCSGTAAPVIHYEVTTCLTL